MLSAEHRTIVKATVPLLESGGEALTTHFYKIMRDGHPEARPLFNQAHQASGAQQCALANGVLMSARHNDELEKLGGLGAQIMNEHLASNILPEHPIVGSCLLRAIRELLGAEIATDSAIEAWGRGPLPLMKAVKKQLKTLGVRGSQSRYELFGPATAHD